MTVGPAYRLPAGLDGLEQGAARDDRHFVTALARGLDVLACFRHGETFLANHEIAARCGLPRSTVSRLTHTLTRLGYLHFADDAGKYRPGARLIAMSAVALGSLEVHRAARPQMRELADFSGAVVGLAVRDGLSMRYVACTRGRAARALPITVGVRISLVRTAMGRAYVAALTHAERAALFEEMEALAPRAWPDVQHRLTRAVAEHLTRGCCSSFGDWQERVSAVAVGFRPGGGLPPMAVNCGAPIPITTPKFLLDEVRPRLIALARSLEGVARAPIG